MKVFAEQRQVPSLEERIKDGTFLKIKGSVVFDDFDKELCMQKVTGIMSISDPKPKREDNVCEKRVELHCHTNMSDMDGISSAGQLIEQAYKWGMPAIAITDHAVVQGLTEGYHFICKYRIYTKLKDELDRIDEKPNYMTVPAAIRELEKIEMIRGHDQIYRLDHAVTKTQKTILKAFEMDTAYVKHRAERISEQLKIADGR